MIPAIIVIALLALAGFLFWLYARTESFFFAIFAVGVLAAGVYSAQGVLR